MNSAYKQIKNEGVTADIIRAIQNVIGTNSANLHEPVFIGNEWKYVKDCLDKGMVSSIGEYVEKFERKIETYTGSKNAVAFVNGTSALHTAMVVAGVKPGDEVIMSSLTFVATANAVSYVGAVPHFVDICQKDFGIDARSLRKYLAEIAIFKDGNCINQKTGRAIKALLPTHVFGHPCKIDSLSDIAAEFHLTLIEDAAESLGSFYAKKHTGTFGKVGIISFNGNKTITTGGGGIMLTECSKIAEHARHLSTTAKQPHRYKYFHNEIAYNYRMPNLNAALGCAQIENLPFFLQSKRKLLNLYAIAFGQIEGVKLFQEPKHCQSNYWLQTLILDEDLMVYHEDIIESCLDVGINVRPVWTPLHLLPIFSNSPASPMTITNNLAKRLINIPSSAGIA